MLNNAKKKRITTLAFLGNKGGKAKKLCDYKIIVGSSNTAIIQEAHIFIGHFVFENVENLFLNKS